jgi:hypothetical protein
LYVRSNPFIYEVPVRDYMLPKIHMLTEVDKDFTAIMNSNSSLQEIAADYIEGNKLRLGVPEESSLLRIAIAALRSGFKNRGRVAIMQKKRLEIYSNVLPPPEYQRVSYRVDDELRFALKLPLPFVKVFTDIHMSVKYLRTFLGENGGLAMIVEDVRV